MAMKKELYDLEFKALKKELEKELKHLLGMAKARMVTLYTEVLGDEYIELISRRQELVEKYKEYISIAFEYVTQNGGEDLVREISSFADEPHKNDSDKVKRVNYLLEEIYDVLEYEYSDLVSLIKHSQQNISKVEEELDDLFSSNREAIKKVRERVKNEVHDNVKKAMEKFTRDVFSLKKKYDIDIDNNEVVAEFTNLDLDPEPNFYEEDENFIPFKRSKGTIN